MKYTFTTLLFLLTASSIMAQEPHNEDGKKLDKTKMEQKITCLRFMEQSEESMNTNRK